MEATEGMATAPPPYASKNETWHYHGVPENSSIEGSYPEQKGFGSSGQYGGKLSHVTGAPGTASQQQTALLIASEPKVVVQQRESFASKVALACCIMWCCCCPLGLAAFILAMMADGKSEASDSASVEKARRLGIHSKNTSIAGVIIGIILIATSFVLHYFGIGIVYRRY